MDWRAYGYLIAGGRVRGGVEVVRRESRAGKWRVRTERKRTERWKSRMLCLYPKCKSHYAWTLNHRGQPFVQLVNSRTEGKPVPSVRGRGGQDAGLSSTRTSTITKTRYRNACVTTILLGLNSLFELSYRVMCNRSDFVLHTHARQA